jgi:tetratricopeptide (TPR) repeat protein
MGTSRRVVGLLLTAVLSVVGASQTKEAPAKDAPTNDVQRNTAKVEAGSEACSGCHSEIYKSYSKTVMANASGLAADGVITGEFSDKTSGVRYRVYTQDEPSRAALGPSGSLQLPSGQTPVRTRTIGSETRTQSVWMSYERESEKFRGQRELLYFIGSGRKGRSYLFSVQGFLFETPINWYTQEGRWGMTPAYAAAREIPMNLPALVDCMNCHSSGLQPPVAGTDNKFSGPPFLHGGITCQRCHGLGEGHGEKSSSPDSSSGSSTMVNPAKLPAERRDAICMECHFEGTVAAQQPGKELYRFQPGERLADYIHYFLLSGNQPQKAETLSQFEALSVSACQRKSGDKMWCGSCHDPHAEPGAEEKAAYYRGKCLNCHGEAFAAKHHPDKPDCTKCHMPALPSQDLAHTEGTDHRILKYPHVAPVPQLKVRGTPGAPLVFFPKSEESLATARDFALAWETLAQRNVEGAGQEAERYLRKAVTERTDDPVLLSALGFGEQKHEQEKEARELYERALQLDPLDNDAATNLGILEARSGNLRRAVELWQGAFARVPYRSAIGMNLAMVFCAAGQSEDARKYVLRVQEFNPDYLKAKQLLAHLGERPAQCRP